jgi:uncharacterized protein
MDIPNFRYHPDPFASGVVIGADADCESCGKARTLFYTGPFYAADEVENICLWCVADGTAAAKFDGLFVDDLNFDGADLSAEIVDEVTKRTPSYSAWQQEQWLVHCNDACEFHGFPSASELQCVSAEIKAEWATSNELTASDWEKAVRGYESEDAGFYKFVCRHCRQTLFATDWS